MKMNAPGSPPAHRLPVLTEVVQLSEADDAGVVVAVPAAPPVAAWLSPPPPAPLVMPQATPPLPPVPPPPAALPVLHVPAEPWATQAPAFAPGQATAPLPLSAFAPVPPPAAPPPQPLVEPTPDTVDIPLSFGPSASDIPADPPSIFIDGEPAPPEWLKRRPTPAVIDLPLPAQAPPSPLPADFSGSWWSRDDGPAVAPTPSVGTPIAPAPVGVTMRAPPEVSEAVVVRRVLQGLDNQIDLMFDHRLRDAVVPALARAADSLMADLREQLAVTLQEMVSQAVAIELARLGRDADGPAPTGQRR